MKKEYYFVLTQDSETNKLLHIGSLRTSSEVMDYSVRNTSLDYSTKVLSFYTKSSSRLKALNFLESSFPEELNDEMGLVGIFKESLAEESPPRPETSALNRILKQ